MGKHDRQRNRMMEEEREIAQSQQSQRDRERRGPEDRAEDQREDQEEMQDVEGTEGDSPEGDAESDFPEGGIKIGKEVKIGVLVLVVLLVVLGIALWSRRHKGEDTAATSDAKTAVADKEKDKEKGSAAPAPSSDPTFGKAAKQLTVVDDSAGQGRKPPAGFAFNTPGSPKANDEGREKPPAQNFMPNPAAFTPAQRPAGGAEVASAPAGRTGFPDHAPGTAMMGQPANPFGSQTPTRLEAGPPAGVSNSFAASKAGNNPLRPGEAGGLPVESPAVPRLIDATSNGLASQSPTGSQGQAASRDFGPSRFRDDARTTMTGQSRTGGTRVYVVQEGDTLYDIARSELGKASRWGEIYDLNRDSLGTRLESLSPGTKLILPDDGSGRPNLTTQRPGSQFPR